MVEHAASLEEAIAGITGGSAGTCIRIPVTGGDINASAVLRFADGSSIFLKENRADLVTMFAAEASGLIALGRAGNPPVPRPLAWGRDGDRSFLLMEVIEPGSLQSGADFGSALAELHRGQRNEKCGFDGDNWIGMTPQINTPRASWLSFFSECRLVPQWRQARRNGYFNKDLEKAIGSLLNRLPGILPETDAGGPSLLHGDLWGGNWLSGADGRAWIFDPAVYYGHREADLAMTSLFGGFPGDFRHGYEEAWPLEPGFEHRVDLYNLYHLLNHLNLFGPSYLGRVQAVIRCFS